MISGLKPYPVMKDSGMPWLGKVPEHWDMRRAKWLFQKMNRPVRDFDEVVTCFRDGTVTLRKKRRLRGFTESLKEIGYQGIRRGDLVIHAMDAFAGAIGVADSDGKGTPVYSVCKPMQEANSHYYAFTVREMARSLWIQALAKGIRERSTDFRFEEFSSQLMPLPSISEQAAIVRFLDYVDRRIRRYIRAKQKLIKLLEEQKQAIIHRAVTRGLDPNVRLKTSGVPWLGEVPEHWIIGPLKQWVGINRSTLTEKTDPDYEFRYIDIGSVRTGRLVNEPKRLFFKNAPSRARRILKRGDTIISTVRTYLKAIWFVNDTSNNLIASTGFAVLTPHKHTVPEYLGFVVQSTNFIDQVTASSIGIAYPAITETTLGSLKIAMSADTEEQRNILTYITSKTNPYNLAIDQIITEIKLVREIRTRLIADVVTGKLDVREAAASLQDEAEEPESIEESVEDDAEETESEDQDETPEEA